MSDVDLIGESCDLANRECVPCRGGIPALTQEQQGPLLAQLQGWSVVGGHHLSKTYTFPDFVTALAFVNRVGDVAERNGHHPDLALSWGKVRVDVWTHKIDGLTESDFVLAAKCDQVL
jgi:4a-hydroxytetrahydrobiopterin dehydratase